MRINARLDENLIKKFEYLTQVTGKNASAIVREAIETYYLKVHSEKSQTQAILEKYGFIACAEAEEDLSQNYKDYLNSLATKHDHR